MIRVVLIELRCSAGAPRGGSHVSTNLSAGEHRRQAAPARSYICSRVRMPSRESPSFNDRAVRSHNRKRDTRSSPVGAS